MTLIKCSKPPVSGSVCEKVICIGMFEGNLEAHEFAWCESSRSFVVAGSEIHKVSYNEMERDYDLFVWEGE